MRSTWGAVVALVLFTLAIGASASLMGGGARDGRQAARSVHDFRVKMIDGGERGLADFKGKALLVVNTASRCGLAPQYRALETLYQRYEARGFEVLAFPANNFLGQEPGTNAEIKLFCSTNYAVTFPLFAKISVKGRDIHPLYRYLTKESGFNGDVPWNFTKFLVDPAGRVVARFGPRTDPLAAEVTAKIESVLPTK